MTRHHLLVVAALLGLLAGCSSGSGDDGEQAVTASTTTTPVEDYVMDAGDFVPLAEMTPVRGFFISNVLGHLDEAIAVAESDDGGVYPVGTVIQLIPQEAMVKRAAGFDPASNDWEFFTLDVSAEGTTIVTHGGSEVVNGFSGSSCASCHGAAEPQFDFVCENTHGCEPLPIPEDVIIAIQESDPRSAD